jgi:hypothetical protein
VLSRHEHVGALAAGAGAEDGFWTPGGSEGIFNPGSPNQWNFYNGTSVFTFGNGTSSNSAIVALAYTSATAGNGYLNGGAAVPFTCPSQVGNASTLLTGVNGPCAGYAGEYIQYNAILTSAQITLVINYLNAQWSCF